MIKGSSKKKRSRAELEEVKQEEELLNRNKQEFLRQFKQLKGHNGLPVVINENVAKNQNILNKLWADGVIDDVGNVLPPKKAIVKMKD